MLKGLALRIFKQFRINSLSGQIKANLREAGAKLN